MLLEYLKVVFSWPPMAVVITLFAVFKFKAAIDDLLSRIVSGKILGQEIHAAPPKDAPQGSVNAPDVLVPPVPDFVAPVGVGVALRDEPAVNEPHPPAEEPLPPELVNDPHARAAIAYVRENPAQTVIEYKKVMTALSSERLYVRIFGTQISVLVFLSSRNGGPVSAPALSAYHEEYQRLSDNMEYSFESYMDFLVGAGAVEKVEAAVPQYRMTPFGVEFLAYIRAQYPIAWMQRAF
ncbi:hypothetical protein [Herbaspirillum sp.]|uniref:hypothetical protein n=1 Tax=Herbaspirillum sp. TaxID=1890675 RepID=UPI001B15D3BC|nr:hypothetical protein [Herbaspirillum sp.]MBO9535214.1 hypothetical protein [Herbaspirillum sp.]